MCFIYSELNYNISTLSALVSSVLHSFGAYFTCFECTSLVWSVLHSFGAYFTRLECTSLVSSVITFEMSFILNNTFANTCFAVSFCTNILLFFHSFRKSTKTESSEKEMEFDQSLKGFRRVYLSVYVLAVFADWLQGKLHSFRVWFWYLGPYVYALYEVYGFSQYQNAVLFVCGFCSSMVFGTIVGSMADRLG